MNDGIRVEMVDGSHDAIPAFCLEVTQEVAAGPGELERKALNEVEPGAVFRCEGELEAAGGPGCASQALVSSETRAE